MTSPRWRQRPPGSNWGEVPGAASLAGGALIVAAGLYLVSTGPREPHATQSTDTLADRGQVVRARV